MKASEIIKVAVAVVVLALAGILIYSQIGPKNTSGNAGGKVEVEKITPIPSSYNEEGLAKLKSGENKNFYNEPDLKNGIGNPQPFNSLR